MDADIVRLRRAQLAAEAPLHPRGVSCRVGMRYYFCGTVGPAFDAWQRALSACSAADALLSQQLGLEAVERVMDGLEAQARAELASDECLMPRRSPGYPGYPIEMNRTIVSTLDATRRIGVSVTGSLLLVPSKSVTAISEIVKKA